LSTECTVWPDVNLAGLAPNFISFNVVSKVGGCHQNNNNNNNNDADDDGGGRAAAKEVFCLVTA